MKLYEQILRRNYPQRVLGPTRAPSKLLGLLEAKADLRSCYSNYILDRESSWQCSDLVNNAHAMFDPKDPFLRVAAERMWIEFYSDPVDAAVGEKQSKVGALIVANSNGRSGQIQGFYEGKDGPLIDYGSVLFDLDKESMASDCSFHIHQATLTHLNPLFEHALLVVRPECRALLLDHPPPVQAELSRRLAEGSWYLLPVILAFSIMLNSRGILRQHPTSTEKIDQHASKPSKRAMLDHIEIKMDLGFSYARLDKQRINATRSPPRLHYVRGHVVRRAGKTFWRSSHLRGDIDQPVVPRTVTFRSKSG